LSYEGRLGPPRAASARRGDRRTHGVQPQLRGQSGQVPERAVPAHPGAVHRDDRDRDDLDAQPGGGDARQQPGQVAVGLARQAMDTQFFQVLSNRLMKSKDVAERQQIEQVRKRLSELTAIIDQQNETVIKRATDTLRGLLSTPDIDAAIEQRLELFDDTFLAVLQANIQAAEKARDVAASARLKQLFEKIVAALQSTAPPAVQFINELVSAPTFEDSLAMVQEGAAQFGPELLQWIDVLLEDLSASGEGNPALDRLARVRVEVERALASAGPRAIPETAQAKPLTDAPPPFTPRLVTREEPEPPPTPPGGKPIIELPSFRRGPRRER